MMRKLGTLAVQLGLVLGLSTAAEAAPDVGARPLSPDQAPAEWVSYAQQTTQNVTDWLNGDAAPGPRLRSAFSAHQPQPDKPAAPLLLKLWIGPDGAVTRIESGPLGVDQAEKDLHTLLLGRRLAPPPKAMRQPLRLAVQLAPPPKVKIGGQP